MNCSVDLLVKCLTQNINPGFFNWGIHEWCSAHGASMGPLGPIIYTPPMKRVVAVKSVLRATNRFEANRTLWKFVIWAVMNTKLDRKSVV